MFVKYKARKTPTAMIPTKTEEIVKFLAQLADFSAPYKSFLSTRWFAYT
jgi:hypothetical protein